MVATQRGMWLRAFGHGLRRIWFPFLALGRRYWTFVLHLQTVLSTTMTTGVDGWWERL